MRKIAPHDPDPVGTRMMAVLLALILILAALNIERAVHERHEEQSVQTK